MSTRVLALAVLAALSVAPACAPSAGRAETPGPGDGTRLLSYDRGEILVARSRSAFELMMRHVSAGNGERLDALRDQGKVLAVPSGTRCRVLADGFLYELEIREGAHRGEVCVVSSEYVEGAERP